MDYLFIIIFGLLLIIAGWLDIGMLLHFFAYHNPFMELFGRRIFRWMCIGGGIFFIILAIMEFLTTYFMKN